jgi:List-Bact-rpt repeat protein
MDVSALPDAGWQFSEWSGPVDDPNAPTTFITIEARSIRVTAQSSEIPGYDKPGDNDSGGSDTGCFVEILSIRQ